MSFIAAHPQEAAICPVKGDDAGLRPDDILHVAMPKRMVVQRGINGEGASELRLFYGDKEITFNEPHLFPFGEELARQSAFRAVDAVAWAQGSNWGDIAPLLQTLIEEGVLIAGEAPSCPVSAFDRVRLGLLPAAPAKDARSWHECDTITRELTGRAVDPGHLELVIPIFRVAHPALDEDGRQVGEANVFPRALRIEAPTDWLACTYPGTRYMSERPMNATALKAMRMHWDQMMAALRVLRTHYLLKFPDASRGWTVGHVERLATFILAVPTYQLVRADGAGTDRLHPALSSLFRVTDGLRMAMHQMMFIPLGEPMVPFDTIVTAAEIHDYAERNYSFHSETGVCAGPRHMVQLFLRVLLDGEGAERDPFKFDPEVAAALADAPKALAYARHGLRAHAALFSVWPLIGRTFEALADSLPQDTLAHCTNALKQATYIGREDWRSAREATYARMFDSFAPDGDTEGLRERIAACRSVHPTLADDIAVALTGVPLDAKPAVARKLADFALEAQAILRVAEDVQAEVNDALGRQQPIRGFELADANVHNLLQEQREIRLPFLLDEIRTLFGLSLTIATDRLGIEGPVQTTSAETTLAEYCADALLKEGVP